MKNLRNKLIIAQLNISQWGAKTYDKKATKSVESAFHTNHDIGKFYKEIVDTDELKKIGKISSKLRLWHVENTLPWGDNGDRLLLVTNYQNYKDKISELSLNFDKEVEKFISKYPELRSQAKIRLNGLYNNDDYPDNIENKFGVRINYFPIPDENDIRLTLPDADLNEIKNNLTSIKNIRLEDAVKDLWIRIEMIIERMINKLSDKDSKFKNSLVDNISDLIQIIPKLNIFDDSKLNKTIKNPRKRVFSWADFIVRHIRGKKY